jgi:hypothetical protein
LRSSGTETMSVLTKLTTTDGRNVIRPSSSHVYATRGRCSEPPQFQNELLTVTKLHGRCTRIMWSAGQFRVRIIFRERSTVMSNQSSLCCVSSLRRGRSCRWPWSPPDKPNEWREINSGTSNPMCRCIRSLDGRQCPVSEIIFYS